MFKDVFILKKTSFHAKIMKYIWNLNYYDFSHMCPYFWLSVFNTLIIVPFFIIKETFKLVYRFLIWIKDMLSSLFELIGEYMNRLEENRLKNRAKFFLENPEVMTGYQEKKIQVFINKCREFDYKLSNKIWKTYHNLMSDKRQREEEQKKKEAVFQFMNTVQLPEKVKMDLINKNEHIKFLNRQREREKALAEQEKERLAAERKAKILKNKQKINSILKVIKPITTWIIYALGAFVVVFGLYYLAIGFNMTYTFLTNVSAKTYGKILEIVLYFLLVLLAIGTIVFIVFWVIKLFETPPTFLVKTWMFILKIIKVLSSPFVFIYKKIFRPLFRGIKSGILLMIQMVKNECPAINWED